MNSTQVRYKTVKRLIDILLISFFLWMIVPLYFIAVVMIAIIDGLPIFFVQQRIGLGGEVFQIIKFRTMTVSFQSECGSFDLGSSSRVTKLGALLRRIKLDELPQLWNVVRGEMTLVGPRPEVRKWVDVYPDRWKKVHQLRPGITDPASITYRNEEQLLAQSSDPEKTYREVVLPHKLSLYEDYVENHSLLGDVKILFQTLVVLVK